VTDSNTVYHAIHFVNRAAAGDYCTGTNANLLLSFYSYGEMRRVHFVVFHDFYFIKTLLHNI
jgi:hypothetical protein